MNCTCHSANLDNAFWAACKHALAAAAENPIAPVVLRNGGWEQTFRNFLATQLELSFEESFSLTEVGHKENDDDHDSKNGGTSVESILLSTAGDRSKKGVKRADIELRCLKCGDHHADQGKILAVEIKMNFISRQNSYIKPRQKEAISQLKKYIDAHVPGFYLHILILLTSRKGNQMAARHNAAGLSHYKKFYQHGDGYHR